MRRKITCESQFWECLHNASRTKRPGTKHHGGKRPGAGRKPDVVKRMIGRLRTVDAAEVLAGIDVEATIAEIMKKGSLSLKQRTLADLMDRAWGRPAQTVSVSGAVVHAHWTPGKYSHLTDEEFAKLVELSAKALAPARQDTSQNSPGFQEKSTVAIEALEVEPEPIEACCRLCRLLPYKSEESMAVSRIKLCDESGFVDETLHFLLTVYPTFRRKLLN